MFAQLPDLEEQSPMESRVSGFGLVSRTLGFVLGIILCPAALADAPTFGLLGLPPISVPPTNPQTPSKSALGQKLFFDKRLSGDGRVSCASCHQPAHAFADDRSLARGISGRIGTRNAPSLRNAAFTELQFWDGRRPSLEAQAGDPFINPSEHGLRSHDQLLHLIRRDIEYREKFRSVFDVEEREIALTHVSQALASYLRTLPAGNSAFDKFQYGKQTQTLPHAARRGLELFRGRARCAACHSIGEHSATFTDNGFHSLGIGLTPIHSSLARLALQIERTPRDQLDQLVLHDREVAALGRFVVTKDPNDIGRFKTPSLRNVALTAPYMHDGSLPTLEQAVDQEAYYRGLEAGRPLILTPAEKADLVAFLRSLTSSPERPLQSQ